METIFGSRELCVNLAIVMAHIYFIYTSSLSVYLMYTFFLFFLYLLFCCYCFVVLLEFTPYLTINWGMYVCVCLCVCVCVCPAIRFHISQRIFSKFGGIIIWVMTRIVGYLFVSAHTVYSLISEQIFSKFAGNKLRLTINNKDYVLFIFTHGMRASARVRERVWLSIRLSMDRFSSELR
jgi:hypothetical protein